MVATVEDALAELQATVDRLATGLRDVRARDASAVRVLPEAASLLLADSAHALDMDRAEAVVGPTGKEVYQDFELCEALPADHPLNRLADLLEQQVNRALAAMAADAPIAAMTFNDRIVQHYPAGAAGISPHRDQGRYRGLIAILCLSGDGPFYRCADRSGSDPEVIADGPGQLVLMKAPDFDGGKRQPFHYVGRTQSPRVSLSLRYDRSKAAGNADA